LSSSLFWINAGLASWHVKNNDEAAFKLIGEGDAIEISRTHIASMDGRTLSSANGEAITSDAVIFATSWRHPYELMFDPSLARDLGIPMPKDAQSAAYHQHWEHLNAEAEKEVIAKYPILGHPLRTLPCIPNHTDKTPVSAASCSPLPSQLETTTPSSSSETCTCKAHPSSLRSAHSRPLRTLKISSPLHPPSTAFSKTERRGERGGKYGRVEEEEIY
jgi:hypothetical protein